jgi:hypothetical protein
VHGNTSFYADRPSVLSYVKFLRLPFALGTRDPAPAYDADNWKAVAAIGGMEYNSEGANAVSALRRVMAKVEALDQG